MTKAITRDTTRLAHHLLWLNNAVVNAFPQGVRAKITHVENEISIDVTRTRANERAAARGVMGYANGVLWQARRLVQSAAEETV